jgi:toxin-antitoxin system PIN domain toxin
MTALNATAGDLPDVNVWLALSAPHHAHHAAAKAYWHDIAHEQVCFCRHTMLGMIRLLCQPKVMKEDVQTTAQGWASWKSLCALPEVALQSEPADLDVHLERFTQQLRWPGPMWPDAYLAAFAQAANLRLVSFDTDFARFPGLNWLQLNTGDTP